MTDRPGATVLVLDGEGRTALAIVRSLRRAGFTVAVVARDRWSLAGSSRGVRERICVPVHPRDDPAAYTSAVLTAATRLGAELVIPVTDSSAEAVLERRADFPPGIVIPFAARSVYRAASDKVLVHRLAKEVGLAVSESMVLEGPSDPAPADPQLYPGVVKPHHSVVDTASGRRHLKVRVVRDRHECEAALRELPPEAFPVLVQRRVRGPGVGYFTARWGGRTLARFAHRRIREKPPSGGASVYRESIALDPRFSEVCDDLLDRLGWNGVAMVECKQDLDKGGWSVVEINGRFWGSLQLAVDAGVDFPALFTRAVLSRPSEPTPQWRTGVRSRWEWGDIDHLMLRLRYSPQQLRLPPDAPSRLRSLIDFLTFVPGRDRLEVLRLSDPRPFFVESLARLGLVR